MNSCKHCQRTFSNSGGLGAHQPYCKSNPNRIQRANSPNAHAKKGSVSWAKGLTKDTDNRIKSRPELVGKKFASSLTGHSDATKRRLSEVAKTRNLGGYVEGSGRGKKGWYNGIFCDSSWELAYVIYCLDHNMSIARNTEKRQYWFDGKLSNYIPDFIVDGKLVEIKGYRTARWEAKIAANPDIAVLYKKELSSVFEYVINTYGKDYIKEYGERTGQARQTGLENRGIT